MGSSVFKRGLLVLSFIFFFGWVSQLGHSETFFGEFKTGLIELKDFRYPVYMYVPENVKPGRLYPMVITIPDSGEDPDKTIAKWTGVADRMTMIILTPTYKRLDDLPTSFDRWFFEVKSMAQSVYPINTHKIFLVGEKDGGAYASYLGITYPEEFSGLAVVNGPFGGPFKALMRYQSKSEGQLPVYVALQPKANEAVEPIEEQALEMQGKGYVVIVKQFDDSVDFNKREFKKELLDWLSEKSEDWQAVAKQEKKPFKEKFRRGVKEFFTVS